MDPYGLPATLLVIATGVTLDTARRWKRQGRIPHPAARLVRLCAEGDLGALDRAWTGFTLRAGQLWTPYQFSVRPGEISAIPYRFAQLCALERELAHPAQWDLFAGNRSGPESFTGSEPERSRRSPASSSATRAIERPAWSTWRR